jgi:hypothetical protein
MTQHKMKALNMTKTEKLMMTKVVTQYVYLLQTREFLNSKEPVYKIGRSKQDNYARFSQYGLGSVLLFQSSCHDSVKLEKEIIDLFNDKYERIKILGNEWFRGDADEMKADFCDIIKNSITTRKIRNNDTISILDAFVEVCLQEEMLQYLVEECTQQYLVEECTQQYLVEECTQQYIVEECTQQYLVEECTQQYLVEECTQQYLVEECTQQYLVEDDLQNIVEKFIDEIIQDVFVEENIQEIIQDVFDEENTSVFIVENEDYDCCVLLDNEEVVVEDEVIEECIQDIENESTQENEMVQVNNKVKGRFYCEICKYPATTNGHLKQHQMTKKHLDIVNNVEGPICPFSCIKCDKGYVSKSGLRKHKLLCKVIKTVLPVVSITPEVVQVSLQTNIDNLVRVIGNLTSLVENKFTKVA